MPHNTVAREIDISTINMHQTITQSLCEYRNKYGRWNSLYLVIIFRFGHDPSNKFLIKSNRITYWTWRMGINTWNFLIVSEWQYVAAKIVCTEFVSIARTFIMYLFIKLFFLLKTKLHRCKKFGYLFICIALSLYLCLCLFSTLCAGCVSVSTEHCTPYANTVRFSFHMEFCTHLVFTVDLFHHSAGIRFTFHTYLHSIL